MAADFRDERLSTYQSRLRYWRSRAAQATGLTFKLNHANEPLFGMARLEVPASV